MKKKPIIILAVIVVLAVGVFVANNLIGAKVADSVDKQLQEMIAEGSPMLPMDIEYSHVTSSPIGGSVTIHGYTFKDQTADATMTGGSIELSMPISEIIALSNDKELESVNEMTITMVSPEVKLGKIVVFEADYFQLSYDGELSLFELQNAQDGILPKSRQSMAVKAKGMKVDKDNLSEALEFLDAFDSGVPLNSALQQQFDGESDFELSAEFDPSKKTLTLKEFASKNSMADMSASGQLKFSGETADDFEPESGNFKVSYDLEAYDLDYPEMGKIKFDGGTSKMSISFDSPEENGLIPGVPDFNMSLELSMDGLEMELMDEITQMMGQSGIPLDQNSIKINEFDIDFSKTGDRIKLSDLTIDIENLINLEASFTMENDKVTNMFGMESEEPVFKSSKIEISGLSDQLNEMIREMESTMPNPLPRKGKKIVIELTGGLSNPQIKGVTDGGL